MDKKDLLHLKNEIDEAKTAVAEFTGKKKSLLDTLKETFNCSSIQEAEEKVLKLEKQIEKLDSQIQNGLNELEEKLKGYRNDY